MKRKQILALILSVMMVSSSVFTTNSVSALAMVNGTTAEEAEETENTDSADAAEEAESGETDEQSRILTDEMTETDDDADGEADEKILDDETAESLVDGDETADTEESDDPAVEEVDRDEIDADLTKGAAEEDVLSEVEMWDDDDMVKVIIELPGDSVIEANSDADPESAYANYKINMLEKKQDAVVAEIEDEVLDGEELEIAYQYTWAINAVATEVPYGTIDEIEALSSVDTVYIQELYSVPETDTDSDETLTTGSASMTGKYDAWTAGYTGKGIKIAIIDTGLDADHPSFAALGEDALTEDSATEDTIGSVLEKLNSYQRYQQAEGSELTADDVYYTTKIAYGFNYCDDSLDITHDHDDQGDHGTHVAGIAAANDVEGTSVSGVAPDAQLYVMKVFGQLGGAYAEDIIAGLEDALLLGADVVNMSLGSSAGFAESGDDVIDKVYQNIAETKTVVAVSAGNSGTFGDDNLIGGSLTSNPDNGVVSSPSTYANAISVASVDNTEITAYYVEADGTKLAYDEGTNGGNDSMETLYGQTLEYVMIGGYGEEEDYADVDVTGKIAVVARGEISFYVKLDNAANAGAVGILVYNNVSGTISADLTGASGTIPFASISMAAGDRLQSIYDAALANGTAATIYFSDEMAQVSNDTGYEMSYFSSWGSTGALSIEPDVTAPGGSIYSTLTDGEYGLMSGTSMSSPQVAGISALLQQYIRSEYPELSLTEVRQRVTALLLSTAEPLAYDEDTYYSVRQQGSGLANVYDAITTDAYLSVDGTDEPQAEVGDSADGVYTYDFDVVNSGDTALYYEISTSVQTEDYTADEDGTEYMATTPISLEADTTASGSAVIFTYDYDENGAVHSHDARLAYLNLGNLEAAEQFRYDLDGDEDADQDDVQAYLDALVGNNTEVDLSAQVAKVNAGETASVHVTVAVSEESKAWMNEHFANGIYVEGFTVLAAKSAGGVDLSIPYLGYYGSWSQSPMIDGGFYYMTDEELETGMSQYYNVLFSNYAGYDDYWEPGYNPYVDEDFDASHISLSPNGDGYADYISDVYVTLLRNAEHLSFTFANTEDETEIYSQSVFDKVTKSYYYSAYSTCLPFIYSWYGTGYAFDGTDGDGNYLENNDQVAMTIYADLGYDDQTTNVRDTWEETITIDTEAPTLDMEQSRITINEDGTQTLTLVFADNLDVAAVNFLSTSSMVKAQYAVEHPETQGEYVTATYDVTGYGNSFYVVLGDYAFNESAYLFRTTDNAPEMDDSLLYGYRAYDEEYTDNTYYGWVSMNTDEENFESTVLDTEYFMDYAINAAAYVDGYVLAVAGDNKLYAITPGLWDEWSFIADLGTSVSTMTYDPVNQCLWAFSDTNQALCKIDVKTGELTQIGSNYSLYGVKALAADDSGTLYAVHTYGYLRTVNTETGAYTTEDDDDYLYYTGLGSDVTAISGLGSVNFSYAMSMVYDAADDCLYWAAFSQSSYWGNYGGLIRVEPDFENNSAILTEIGIIEGNAEIVGLLKLEDRGESVIPDDAELQGIDIEETSAALLVGGSQTLTVNYTPWYAQPDDDLVWTSEDETIATVNSYGGVTGVSVGETTVTVSTADGLYTDSCTIKVLNPDAELNGFALYGYNGLDYQWISFAADEPSGYTVQTEPSAMGWTAAEYYDGYVYAFNDSGDFYRIDAETYEMAKLGSLDSDYFYGYGVYDMAYDYATGFMYAVDDYGYLYKVDMLTGMTEYAGYLEDSYGEVALTLAVSTTGTIYFITPNGFLCTYDPETWECTDIGLTGVGVYEYYQSMAYDHNGGGIYWAAVDGLYYVDTETGNALYLGNVDGALTQITGLYTVIDEIPERDYVAVDSVYATTDSVLLLEGMTSTIPVQVYPFNATDRTISWEIEDESVAAIDNGSFVGKSVGQTVAVGTLGEDTVEITITVKPSTGTLNAYLLYDLSAGGAYSWVTFEDNNAAASVNVMGTVDYTVYAGEYYDGKIYTSGLEVDENYNASAVFAVLDAETYETETYIADASLPYANDMAFDYSTGTMYAVGGQSNSDETYLYMIDTETGTYYQIAKTDVYLSALACTTDGILYAMDEDGCLYEVDKATADLTYICYTGYSANMMQSMAYDHDTGNLYWAQCSSSYWDGTACDFLLIDPENGSVAKLGMIGSAGAQAVALFSVPEKEIEIASTEPTGISFNVSSAVLSVGDTLQLSAGFTPISVVKYEGTIIFASSNDSVATVDESGLVTAVAKGSATITASCGTVSGTCKITVTDDSVQFYAFDSTGVYTVPVYSPQESSNYLWYDNSSIIGSTEFSYVAYSSEDELYYALDEDNYLWSFACDGNSFSYEQKITEETSLAEAILAGEDPDGENNYYATVIDMTMNNYTDTLYVMAEIGVYYASMNYYSAEHYYIYAVDVSTGGVTREANIPYLVGTPSAFVFTSADRIVWYDDVNDYVLEQEFCYLDDDEDLGDWWPTQLAWVQNTLSVDGKLAMVYSESMNRIYLAAWNDSYYSGSYFYGLYEFDLSTNQISLIGEATYWDAIDLILFE